MTHAEMYAALELSRTRQAHRRAVERGEPSAITVERRRAKERRKYARKAARKALNAS